MINDLILASIAFVFGAAVNRYAGWDSGDRYISSLAIAGLCWPILGVDALYLAAAFLVWRSIGWYKSLDMGKDAGGFLRDFSVMTIIGIAPAAVLAVAFNDPYVTGIVLLPPVVYTAVMRGLPNKPNVPHIAVAEILTGGLLGVYTYIRIYG